MTNGPDTLNRGGDVEKREGITGAMNDPRREVAGATGGATGLTLKRQIKSRHSQMIAIGGIIGTSFFVVIGQSLYAGGPGFLLAAYSLVCLAVYGVATAIVEVGAFLPVTGATMSMHCSRYVSKSLGVALGYLYFYSFGIIAPYEATAATVLIDYWPQQVDVAVWVTLLLAGIIALNCFPVGLYAESEFWFAGIKVILIVGLLILSVVLILGGGPDHHRLGFYYWVDPGATKEFIVGGASGRFVAFLYCVIQAQFSFSFSPELIIVTSGEMENPRKNLPRAVRTMFWRLVLFYLLGVIAIGAICPSNAPGLVSGAGNVNASPWVIAIRNAGIEILPSIVNAAVLTSAWSSGSSFLYLSSRSLYSLAANGDAPKIFMRCNRWGLPYYAVLASAAFSPLAYLVCNTDGRVVLNWFVGLTNTAGYTSWVVCCFTYCRFRKACKAQGVTPTYHSYIQPYAAWICMFFFTALCFLNGFTVFFSGRWSTASFVSSYLGIPVFLILFIGHKMTLGREDPWLYPSPQVDLTTGLETIEEMTQAYIEAELESPGKSGVLRCRLSHLFL
ncbi:AAT family amino acid transporter [Xylaria palmicola]|nr:AAT family amino acid transporter [Xylaria palmicola]